MLHLPDQLCVKNLPNSVKEAITKKLSAYEPIFNPDHIWPTQYWKDHQPIVLNFLNTTIEGQQQHFREFHYYTRGLDRTRAQSFETALPEFAELIKPYFEPLDRLLVVGSPVST